MRLEASSELADGLDGGRGPARDDDTQRGRIECVEVVDVQNRHDRGRGRRDEGHSLTLDGLEDGPGREALHENGPRARKDRLQQADIAPVEAHRQVDEEHVPVRDPHILVQEVDRIERRVEGM
jgi:hypothetical protein